MYFIGLDLGKANDYSAVCIAQRHDFNDRKSVIEINNVDRFPLGTPYVKVAQHMSDLVKKLPDAMIEESYVPAGKEIPVKSVRSNYILVVDATGVGNAVVELLRAQKLRMAEIVITGGAGQPHGDGQTHLAKVHLVSALRVAFESGRLKVSDQMPHWAEIMKELMDFKETIGGTGVPTYGNESSGGHDDLVLAMALAVWKAGVARPFMFG